MPPLAGVRFPTHHASGGGLHHRPSSARFLRDGGRFVDTPKKFQCRLCHYSTNIMTNLRHHIRVHSGERPFKCTDCGKGFIQKIQMIKHSCLARLRERSATPSSSDHSSLLGDGALLPLPSSYTCSQCGQGFPREILLVQHVVRAHAPLH